MNPTVTTTQPPYYILFSHSPLSTNTQTSTTQSASLGHPTIQYHYADDSPLSLLPQTPEEHVLVMDYDPSSASAPTVNSISKNMAVTGLKVAEAPGAAAAEEGGLHRNDRMYIIETTTIDDKPMETSQGERKAPQAVLAQFKQRNAVLRRAFVQPESSKGPREIKPSSPPGSLPISPSRPDF